MDLIVGFALVSVTLAMFWRCLPEGKEVAPFLRKPGMEVTVTLLFVMGFVLGVALLTRGLVSL